MTKSGESCWEIKGGMSMKIYRVWYQKEGKDYQAIFGNVDTAKAYADGIIENEDINFVHIREYVATDDGIFQQGAEICEYGMFDPLTEGWGYVM